MNNLKLEATRILTQDILPAFLAAGIPMEESMVDGIWVYEDHTKGVYVQLEAGVNCLNEPSIFGSADVPVKTQYSGRGSSTEYAISGPAATWLEDLSSSLPNIKQGIAVF